MVGEGLLGGSKVKGRGGRVVNIFVGVWGVSRQSLRVEQVKSVYKAETNVDLPVLQIVEEA